MTCVSELECVVPAVAQMATENKREAGIKLLMLELFDEIRRRFGTWKRCEFPKRCEIRKRESRKHLLPNVSSCCPPRLSVKSMNVDQCPAAIKVWSVEAIQPFRQLTRDDADRPS